MNKQKIIDLLNSYHLNKDEFIIISGAALVLQNITESTHDIDIWTSEKYYDYLLKNYQCEYERTNEFGKKVYLIDDIINFSPSFKPDDFITINGYKVASLKDCYAVKKYLNRPKDQEILAKLESIIK